MCYNKVEKESSAAEREDIASVYGPVAATGRVNGRAAFVARYTTGEIRVFEWLEEMYMASEWDWQTAMNLAAFTIKTDSRFEEDEIRELLEL